MQGKKSNDPLDSVLHKLDYTFIDLPEFIDDDEEPEPEPVYTQSVYAFDASRGHTTHEQQHHQQGSSTAVSGSCWQQLQQFGETKQPAPQVPGIASGVLGASLAQAVQQQYQQFGQQQHHHQQQQQQRHQQQQQQQQQGWGWQQPHEPATLPAGRPMAGGGAAAGSSSGAGGMDEG